MTFEALPNRMPRIMRAQRDAEQIIIDIEQVRRGVSTDDLGVWQSFTPTWGGWTDFNGTVDARYTQIGKLVMARYQIIVGSDTSPTGTVGLSLPVTATTAAYGGLIESHYGTLIWRDAGSATYPGSALLNSATEFGFGYHDNNTAPFRYLRWSNTQAPFTIANGDEVHAELMFEAA